MQVSEGSGTLLVVAVGVHSEWGRTLATVSESGDDQTPLQVRAAAVPALPNAMAAGAAQQGPRSHHHTSVDRASCLRFVGLTTVLAWVVMSLGAHVQPATGRQWSLFLDSS